MLRVFSVFFYGVNRIIPICRMFFAVKQIALIPYKRFHKNGKGRGHIASKNNSACFLRFLSIRMVIRILSIIYLPRMYPVLINTYKYIYKDYFVNTLPGKLSCLDAQSSRDLPRGAGLPSAPSAPPWGVSSGAAFYVGRRIPRKQGLS